MAGNSTPAERKTLRASVVEKLPFLLAGGRGGLRGLGLDHALLEFVHTAGRIDELLLAGEKGMARGADAEAEILFGGAGVIDRAAGADDLAFHIFGVDIRFHGESKTVAQLAGRASTI